MMPVVGTPKIKAQALLSLPGNAVGTFDLRDLIKTWLLVRAMDNFVAPQGVNLRSNYEILPDLLSDALVRTVNFLQSIEPDEAGLYQYADWWEHDGLHFAKGRSDFATLSQIVKSPTALLEGMPGDFCVFVGVAPQDFRWYLRFYLDPDAEEEERSGRFDLTLPTELVASYKDRVVWPLELEMQEQDADQYYRSIQL